MCCYRVFFSFVEFFFGRANRMIQRLTVKQTAEHLQMRKSITCKLIHEDRILFHKALTSYRFAVAKFGEWIEPGGATLRQDVQSDAGRESESQP